MGLFDKLNLSECEHKIVIKNKQKAKYTTMFKNLRKKVFDH